MKSKSKSKETYHLANKFVKAGSNTKLKWFFSSFISVIYHYISVEWMEKMEENQIIWWKSSSSATAGLEKQTLSLGSVKIISNRPMLLQLELTSRLNLLFSMIKNSKCKYGTLLANRGSKISHKPTIRELQGSFSPIH